MRVVCYLGDIDDTTKLKSEEIIELLCRLHAYSVTSLSPINPIDLDESEYKSMKSETTSKITNS